MRAQWVFKSFRPSNPRDRFPICRRFPIRHCGGPFIGTQLDALAFARKACEHLSAKGVVRVEAWSEGRFEPEMLSIDNITFRLKAHDRDWIAETNALRHGGRWPDLDGAINYALFRGSGKLCRIEVLNTAGALAWLVLVDQSEHDTYAGMAPTWKQC